MELKENPVVSISKCDTYDKEKVDRALGQVLEPLGGITSFVKPGDNVLLKVNLLRSADPDKAVTTHPALIEAVISAVRGAGGVPTVGDSPGGPNTPKMVKKLLETTKIGDLCKQTGTDLVIFDRDIVRVKCPDGKLYTSLTIGRAVHDADVVITLPKLKTHSFMRFTGAVKVLFGVIPGMEKMQYHLKVPDRMDFADMLLDIYLAVKPSLSIMDAVVGMEGEGPSGGDPKHVGALLAARDSVALDFAASTIVGFDPLEVYTNRAAVNRGLITGMDGIEIAGVPISDILLNDFKIPAAELSDKMPGWLVKSLKNIATSRPYLAFPHQCTGCGTCKQSCPNKAIAIKDKHPQFDYNKCIRCYCCEELCPELAVKRKNHWMARPFVKS
jgi:uncharacterized protein (DUF362 family)/Pyruvate/2-oxoacid:ferredoxin oxidoreductase delta subunit